MHKSIKKTYLLSKILLYLLGTIIIIDIITLILNFFILNNSYVVYLLIQLNGIIIILPIIIFILLIASFISNIIKFRKIPEEEIYINKMVKNISKIIIAVVTIFFIISLAISVFESLYENKNLLYNKSKSSAIDKLIIERFKEGPGTVSWNTKQYGRIYAVVCSGPPNDYKDYLTNKTNRADPFLGVCFDGGTSFYDSDGKFITNCGSGWGGDDLPILCKSFFSKLSTYDADYVK